MIVADLAQHLDRGHDALGVLAFDAGLFIRVCAECKIERVVPAAQLVEGDLVSDVHIDLRINADGEERRGLRVQDLARQTVGGNAVAQHTAELRPLFIHRDLVAHQREIVRRGKTARPAADDGDRLAGLLSAGGMGHIARVIDRVALEPSDIHRVVDHVAAAARLTGMLADVRAGGGEGVILPDEPHSVRVAAILHQHGVARNVHARRAQRHAGDRILHPAEAAVAQNVFFIVVAEALDAVEHQPRRVAPDGAVRAVDDHARRALDERDGLHRRLAVEHALHQIGELTEADAAGHALAAGLRVAEVQKVHRKIHRAQPRRAGGNAPLHVAVQSVDHGLGARRRHNVKSRQNLHTFPNRKTRAHPTARPPSFNYRTFL